MSLVAPSVRATMANAPFKDRALPAPLERIRRKLKGVPDGDRHGVPMRVALAWGAPLMVEILGAVLGDGLGDGLPAVEAARAEALAEGVHSADVVLNILARRREPAPPATIMTPEAAHASRMSPPPTAAGTTI